MKNIEKSIIPLLQSQFPSFFLEDGPLFVSFVQAYYEWLEQEGEVNYHTRRLLEYDDIDQTPDDFIVHFKNKFLNNIQFDTATNKRLIIKNSRDLYRSKGSERGLELFFKLVYADPVSLYYPKKDIMKASDNEWIVPFYLEVTESTFNENYLGQEIIGGVSGATAFVDRIVRRRANEKYVNLFYISNIKGDFLPSEPLQISGNSNLIGVPFNIGSVNEIDIVGEGSGFSVGEIVDLISNNGAYGQGIVRGIANISSIVDFTFIDGGYGYTNSASILISDHVLTLANIQISNTQLPTVFDKWETISQPMANIAFNTATGFFAVGDIIENWNTGVLEGTGQILALDQSFSANGTMLIAIDSGNINFDTTFNKQGNSVTAVIATYTDDTATGNVMGFSSNATLHGNSYVGNFKLGEIVFQSTGNAIVDTVSIDGSNVALSLANLQGVFVSGIRAVGKISNASINVSSWDTKIGVINTTGSWSNLEFNLLKSPNSLSTATITKVSTGSGATFKIGSLSNTENIWFNTDFLRANNVLNVPYMSIKLDGSNSGEAGNGYGFPANPSGGPNAVIVTCLTILNETIGEIQTITSINPGTNYNESPFVDIREDFIAGYNYYDDIITLDIPHSSGAFSLNEIITQNVPRSDLVDIVYNNVLGTFTFGELIYQSNGTANVATGTVAQANSTDLILHDVSGTFTTSFKINGVKSGANANVVSVTPGAIMIAKGLIRPSLSNSSVLYVKRMSFLQDFVAGVANVVGSSSDAQANVLFVDHNLSSNVMGDNAVVTANVATSNGGVTAMDVYDSGFGYLDGEGVTFRSLDQTKLGTAQVFISKQGHSVGHFTSDNGFLSNGKYLYDGEFYQDFSYVIKSPLPFDKYSDMLTKVMHVSGMKMFGEVDKISVTNGTMSILSSSVTQS